MDLEQVGWDAGWASCFEPWAGQASVQPGRVLIEFNHLYRVFTTEGEVEAAVAGSMKHRAASRSELPAVGDWVVLRSTGVGGHATILAVLPRRGRFSRKVAGHVTDEQVVAANVDVVFLTMALDQDFSPRRLERYLLLARESGAEAVVVLTKPDLCGDTESRLAEVHAVKGLASVHVVNPRLGHGIDAVGARLLRGCTGALLGISGVGKSTIINRLAGRDVQKTREVRSGDSKGRHTTIHRELVVLPTGGLIIDTPGMRELQLWDVAVAVRETFDDVAQLARECRFSDCRHREEPDCAVKAAVASGAMTDGRLESYLKLKEELAHLELQQDERQRIHEKRRGRTATRTPRSPIPRKGR